MSDLAAIQRTWEEPPDDRWDDAEQARIDAEDAAIERAEQRREDARFDGDPNWRFQR